MAINRKNQDSVNDNVRNTGPSPSQQLQPRGKPIYDKVYVGIVKDNRDVQRMGRLRVYIPEFGGAPTDEKKWITVMYCSPFGGSTPPNKNTVDGKEETESQKSYGMWMIAPDLENQVVVMFLNGEPSKGIYIGSLFQQNMNSMVPAIGANPGHKPGAEIDGGELNPPTTEYNKTDQSQDGSNPVRPRFEPLHTSLLNQGTYPDTDRGPSTASSRRESPSQVFGLNTPRGHHIFIDDGEIEVDESTGKAIVNKNENAKKPLANEYIRIRTRSGTQILVNDTLGYIYMNSRQGNSWFELSDEGINFYTAKSFNIRAQENMNIRVDGNLNLEVLGTSQWRNGGDVISLFESDQHTKVNGESRLTTLGTISIGSKGNIIVGAEGQLIHKANRIIQAAGRIDQNSFNVGGPREAKDVGRSAQRDRKLAGPGYPEDSIGGGGSIVDERGFVTHEPWNYHQRIEKPNNSEASVGVVENECETGAGPTNPNATPVNEPEAYVPPEANNPRVNTSPGNTNSTETNEALKEYKEKHGDLPPKSRELLEESRSTLEEAKAQVGSNYDGLIADVESGKIDPESPEYSTRYEQVQKDSARIVSEAQVKSKSLQAEANRIASQELAKTSSTNEARPAASGRTVTPTTAPTTATNSTANTQGRTTSNTTTNNNDVNAALTRYQEARARDAGRIAAEEARLGRPLDLAERRNFDKESRSMLAQIRSQETARARVELSSNPGNRSSLPIKVDYIQDLEKRSITLENGAVLEGALKDPRELQISDKMFEKIKGEYPFREKIVEIKETGVMVIGYGTQVTDEVLQGLSTGLVRIGDTVIGGIESVAATVTSGINSVIDQIKVTPQIAEQMLRARVDEVQNTIASVVKVPLSQNQFDSMVSLGENIGPEKLAQSPVVENINNGDVQGAVDSYNCYTHGGSLKNRRNSEAANMASGGASNYSGKAPPESEGLGGLSKKYESKGDPTVIGYDSTGGHSYGEYQIATKTGTMDNYMNYVKTNDPETYNRLQAAGGAEAAKRGDPGFKAAWKETMSDPERAKSQHGFISASHYTPAASKIAKTTGIDVSQRSKAVQDVVWSTSVQHGAGGANKIFARATANLGPNPSDEEIIKAVYTERSKNNGAGYFGSSTPGVRSSVVRRFKKEEADALAMLRRDETKGTRNA